MSWYVVLTPTAASLSAATGPTPGTVRMLSSMRPAMNAARVSSLTCTRARSPPMQAHRIPPTSAHPRGDRGDRGDR